MKGCIWPWKSYHTRSSDVMVLRLWDQVNMDEYVGIPKNHPQSYHTFMFENCE